jgi:pimeloyl-ACP methyl ester carboxylesterase
MDNPRIYGKRPYSLALVHGGPGAGGEMAPVARALAGRQGVLEPIQTATTLDGQVEELAMILEQCADFPAVLAGYSWGAWLAVFTAARFPKLVKKLVLISSGPFTENYVARIHETRMSRLTFEEQAEFDATLKALEQPGSGQKDTFLARLGALASKTDSFDPIPNETHASDRVGLDGSVYQQVWGEAAQMRRDGRLLEMARQVACPVVSIHGDRDPHPAEGVEAPLAAVLKDFRFILLKNCGHTPWLERCARDAFFEAMEREV